MPCAIARAVILADPDSANEPVAALDLGDATTLLTIVERGRPVFCRVLRSGSLETVNQRMQEQLQLSRCECRQMLTRVGVPSGQETGEEGLAIHQVIGRQLEQLVDEVRRTIQFVTQQSPRLLPKRLWLLGGGGTIRNLSSYLANKTGLSTRPWTLLRGGSDGNHTIDPLFAVAAGLSALGWESAECT